ncbi:hypothetical protein HCJ66_14705 [Listeria sp. FSL L7-1582]|uniref:hypothetical protein n=1 Tax=Listeria portnoyi TaxID=2713504 RepID=UPI00164EB1EE|nr:hypothetical protein [Listeria portnoyi]MBC6310788.1 hypothetical protein [Listeria portnoyi]
MKKGIGILLLGFVLLLAACGSNEKQAETSDKLTIQLDEKNVTAAAVKEKQKEQAQAVKDKAQKEVTESAKPNAAKISFAMLNGNPDKYARESYYLKGQVAEVIDGGATKYLKVNMTQDGGSVMVIYTGTTDAKKGDVVEVYGTIYGTYAFDDANGETIAMPGITASSISVVE